MQGDEVQFVNPDGVEVQVRPLGLRCWHGQRGGCPGHLKVTLDLWCPAEVTSLDACCSSVPSPRRAWS